MIVLRIDAWRLTTMPEKYILTIPLDLITLLRQIRRAFHRLRFHLSETMRVKASRNGICIALNIDQ
jgi:hypothetical protein